MYEDKELFINEIRPDVYLLDEAHEATGFVVIGHDKACVIDTMISYNDLKKAIRSIADKPLMVINTHGHPDHIYGNIFFEEAYINPKDIPLTKEFVKEPEFLMGCEIRGLKMPIYNIRKQKGKPLQDRRSNENFIFKPVKVPGLRHTFGSGAFSLP